MIGNNRVVQILIISTIIIAFAFPCSLFSQEEEKSEEDRKTEALFKMSLEELMNVKITTADKTEQKIADIPASVVLITREDIEMYGYKTLTEILNNIPGLYSTDDYMKGGANFGVRGFWSGVPNDNMIILVNGVHQVNDLLTNYPWNSIAIPVEAIERIEVIRGPMSVIYGSGAFYGAINIFTKKIPEYEPISIVSGSIGSEKTKKLFLRVADEKDDFYYIFNASIYDTYGIDKPLSDMVSNPAALPALGVPENSRTGGKLQNTEKYFNFAGTFKEFSLNISHNETKEEFYFNLPSYSYGTYVNNHTTHIAFGYKKEFSDTLTLEGKFTYSKTREWQKYDVLFENFYGNQDFDSNAIELGIDTFITPSDDLKITTGLYYRSVLNASTLVDLPSFGNPALENYYRSIADGDNIETRALYTQVNYSPFDSLRLVGGIRLEQTPKYGLIATRTNGTNPPYEVTGAYDRDNIQLIPRFAAIYYLNDQHIFKFLFGKAINRPSFFQNLQNSLDPLRDDLDPESIETLELNYISTISSSLTLNASIFRNTLENLITRVVKFYEPTGTFQSWSDNAGKMITTGVELTVQTEPFDHLRIELSGIFQNTKDKRPKYEDIDVAYSPGFLGYLKASYRTETFSLAVTGNYVGTMETFWDETLGDPTAQPISGERIGEKVDGYFALGANLHFEDLFFKGLYLNLKCSNLLDEEIRYPTFTNNSYFNKGTIGLGRSFLLSLGYKF